MKTLREKLIWLFKMVDHPLAIHEIQETYKAYDLMHNDIGYSQPGIAACMRVLTQEHILVNNRRENKRFKEWKIYKTDGNGQGKLL